MDASEPALPVLVVSSVVIAAQRGPDLPGFISEVLLRPMKTLTQSQGRRSAKAEEKALYISVMSSSAIEGIRAPFAEARWAKRHKDMDSLIAHWKRPSRR